MNIAVIKAKDIKTGMRVAVRGVVRKIRKKEESVLVWFQGSSRWTVFSPDRQLKIIE